ncbi:hypothetical protein N0V94_008547 [Neodidymelliopsis sp. IMI 364377]|nr:hypothetical protein N0V94_008547 [Neodidymelliopsis sp. IMI 364377]
MASQDLEPRQDEVELGHLLERLSQFYVQNLLRAISPEDARCQTSPITGIFGFAEHIDPLIRSATEPFKDDVDVRLLKRIGEDLVKIADGEVTAIEIAMEDHLLNEVCVASLGLKEMTHILARVVCQITHRYPHLNVLEVGGRTVGFLRCDPRIHGPGGTKDLRQTMQNIRRLLKPGGYLIIQEGFNNDVGRNGAIFGAFPDWWLGAGEGRILGPLVSIGEWD